MFSFRFPEFISNESTASFDSRTADSDAGSIISALNSAFANLGLAAQSSLSSVSSSPSASSASSSSSSSVAPAPISMSATDAQTLQLLCPISQRASLRRLHARRQASLSAPSSSDRSSLNPDAHCNIGSGDHDDDDDDDVEWAEKQCVRGPSELIPGALYLGSAADAHNASATAALGVSAVVNAAAEMASIPSEPPSPLLPLGRTRYNTAGQMNRNLAATFMSDLITPTTSLEDQVLGT